MTDDLAKKLRAQGFRITPQRMAILNILRQQERHLSPLEVYQFASQIMPGLTEATVYRTLNWLSAQGLALPAYIGSGQLVYEIAGHNHHHLICRRCGHTQEISHSLLEDLYQQFQVSTGYEIDSIHVTFFGLCPYCQKN